jgi:hypothetical protein
MRDVLTIPGFTLPPLEQAKEQQDKGGNTSI